MPNLTFKTMAKIILAAILIAASLTSPEKIKADTDGSASYGPFYCVRHGYGDDKTCVESFTNNNNSEFQTYLGTIRLEAQGYGSTSEVRVKICLSSNAYDVSNACKEVYNNSDFPDTCPDPDDNCDIWNQIVGGDSIQADTQDYNDYNFVNVEIYVKDAGVRAFVNATGRRVSASLTTGSDPIYPGDSIQVNWSAEHAYNTVFLGYGGNIVEGTNAILVRGPGCCNENNGSYYFTAGNPGTAWFELAASGPGGYGLIETVQKIEVIIIPRAGGNTGEGDNQGTIIVKSNIITSWIISGPENFSGSGDYASYNAPASTANYFISVPELTGYTNPVITPGFNQTLVSGGTIVFDIFYGSINNGPTPTPTPSPNPGPTPTPPPTLEKPIIISASNNKCGEIILKWNDTPEELGYHIYRSENQNNGDISKYQKIASVNQNITSYLDKPAPNKAYFYIVSAWRSESEAEAASTPFKSDFVTLCTALVTGQMKLVAVNSDANYNINQLKDNDTVTIEILIDNQGLADGYVTKIATLFSNNLVNPRNLVVTGPNTIVGNPSISGIHPNFTFNISGKKEVAGIKWSVKFDATIDIAEHLVTDQFSTCATIFYYDDSGNKTTKTCLSALLAKSTPKQGVEFRESAP